MKIGILEEGKVPPDERVPFTPEQCVAIKNNYPCELFVQESKVRRIGNKAYAEAGIELLKDVGACDVLFAVKEVPIDRLIDGKTYFFFSHTIKEQPYNRALLQKIMEKEIRLIDYECLVDDRNFRLLGFGRHAGIVGTYNGIRMIGIKEDSFYIKKAHNCLDMQEMFRELHKVTLNPIRICITGMGRVAGGAIEVLEKLNIRRITVEQYLKETFNEAVYVQLDVTDYNRRIDGSAGIMQEFFNNPELYESDFERFYVQTDFYIAAHFWDSNAPFIFTKEEMASRNFNLKYISDVSCDINGPVASTIRPSTIENPFYGMDKSKGIEVAFETKDSLAVMAVDNLPCELPVDASLEFGKQLMKHVIPALFNGDADKILQRATIAENGKLTERFRYLEDYVNGK